MKPQNVEKNYDKTSLEADSNFIEPGTYYARLQYITQCKSNGSSYYFFHFETNKIRVSNGKRYKIKQLVSGDSFKSIFYFENYKIFTEPLNKVFTIEVVKDEKGYIKIQSATEFLEYDENVNISIPKTQEDWTFFELSKLKNVEYIYFAEGRKKFDEFLDEVEEYEIEERLKQIEKQQDEI